MTRSLVLLAFFVSLCGPLAKAADDVDSSHVWTQTEMEQLKASPEFQQGEGPGANHGIWYCQAQSYVSGFWYYWYSYNFSVARYNALNACVAYNGYTCNVGCVIR